MQKTKWLATVATMVVLATPAAAQWPSRLPGGSTTTRTTRTDDGRYGTRTNDGRYGSQRNSAGIPPGQMPPAGMCRVWIDGVPPGRQPAPTDCATAYRTRPANARVIYGGDGSSFPGKGKGKYKHANRQRGDDRYDRRDREDDGRYDRRDRDDDDRYDRRGRDDDDDDDNQARGSSSRGSRTTGSWPVRGSSGSQDQGQSQRARRGRPFPN